MRFVAIALIAVGMLFTAGGVAALVSEPELDPAKPYGELPTDADGDPVLTKDQLQGAVEILGSDPSAQAILGDGEYTVVESGPWFERDASGVPTLVGATMIVELTTPRDVAMRDWPVVTYADGMPETTLGDHYEASSAEFAVEGLRHVLVNVDLGSNRLVGLSPTGDADKVTPSADTKERLSQDRGSGY